MIDEYFKSHPERVVKIIEDKIGIHRKYVKWGILVETHAWNDYNVE